MWSALLRILPLLCCALLPRAQEVSYHLQVVDRAQQTARVTARFPTKDQDELLLFAACWSPGYYRLEKYWERWSQFTAQADTGKQLELTQPAPNRWRIATQGAAAVEVSYELRCAHPSVTGNEVTNQYAVFHGPATFVGEVGQLARHHGVQVTLPDDWHDAVAALPESASARHFVADNFDQLLDAPIVLGNLQTLPFQVQGAPHQWVVFGAPGSFDHAGLIQRLQPIASEVCNIFGAVPFAKYSFLAGFRRGGGGLEHANSCLLTMSSRGHADDPDTLSFLAHEYAHAFNVKRLRPIELGPFDYEQPPTTEGLWVAEGLTTWFGDLALARSGAITREQWLGLVSATIGSLQRAPGRHRQSLAEASRTVWKGSMSGVGGDPRLTISYYVKGPVVGLLLDARLRSASNGAQGLDAMMRLAYQRYAGKVGFQTPEFEALATELVGHSQAEFFARAIRSHDELDYQETLAWFGLRFQPTAAEAKPSWQLEIDPAATPEQQQHLATLLAPTAG